MEIRKLLFIFLILICLDCKLTGLNNPYDTKSNAYLETALWNCVFERLVPCYEITQQNNGIKQWTRLSGGTLVTLDGMALSSDRYGTIFLTGGTTGNFDGKIKTGTKDAFVIQYK